MSAKQAKYRRLDPAQIVQTVAALKGRIDERFPGSGLGRVVGELLEVAEATVARAEWIQRPQLLLRLGVVGLTVIILAVLVGLLMHIRQFRFDEYTNSIQALDASISSMVFIGAAVLFLLSWENRIKRSRALSAIHELRALAHIIDMHQLTKDPEGQFLQRRPANDPARSPMTPHELIRYLNHCSDSLALISKIAALYVQGFPDTVLLDAVDDVEDLTAGFSRKIWQKITILEQLGHPFQAPAKT